MIENYFSELWRILLELSPPLLLGILLAGLLHVFLPTGFVHRQLSRREETGVVDDAVQQRFRAGIHRHSVVARKLEAISYSNSAAPNRGGETLWCTRLACTSPGVMGNVQARRLHHKEVTCCFVVQPSRLHTSDSP